MSVKKRVPLVLMMLAAAVLLCLPALAAPDSRSTIVRRDASHERIKDRRVRNSLARNALIRPYLRSLTKKEQKTIVAVPRAQLPFITTSVQETEQPLEFSYLLSEPISVKKQEIKESKSPIRRAQATIVPVNTATGKSGKVAEVSLGQGSMLVLDNSPVKMRTEQYAVNIAPSTAAYVIQLGKELAVYNLDSRHPTDVTIAVGTAQIQVPIGRVLIVTSDASKPYSDLSIAKYISCENPTSLGTHEGVHVYSAEFSYVSALDNCPQLQQLIRSGIPQEHKAARKLLKLAVIMDSQ